MTPPPKQQRPGASSAMHTSRSLNPEVETLSTGASAAASTAEREPASAPVPTEGKTVPFGSYMPEDLKRQFKARCAERGIEMQDALAEAVRSWLASEQTS